MRGKLVVRGWKDWGSGRNLEERTHGYQRQSSISWTRQEDNFLFKKNLLPAFPWRWRCDSQLTLNLAAVKRPVFIFFHMLIFFNRKLHEEKK